eukprot:GHRR01010289.1.p1 GENE.GHRR01010289.1~~GHRR01010289.1.p1  ORF type:complete len:195 (+),score=34.01 GHRR01010289.1:514-1098(+)
MATIARVAPAAGQSAKMPQYRLASASRQWRATGCSRPLQSRQPAMVCSSSRQNEPRLQQCVEVALLASAAAVLATGGAAHAAEVTQQLYGVAELDAAAAHTLASVLRPLFSVFTILYIVRIPMTWYPSIDGTKLPWLLAYAPTEPVLRATRNIIPLVNGVDVSPIVWVGLISFFNEILLGPQGILILIQRETGL